MLDKKAIETLSVNAVRDSIVTSPFLDQFIADNDKEPSWDGNVYIYEDTSKTKAKLKGRLPVQIKGKQSSDFSKEQITYSMSTADLKNYLYDGGAVLFVVYVNEKSQKKIYYAELTPIKLRFLLNGAKEQKTKTVELKSFPEDGNKKATIFLNCLQNCQKQASFSNAKLYTLEELEKKGMIEGLTIPLSGAGINDLELAFLTNEIYLYANVKGSSIPQPLELLSGELFTHRILENEVKIDEKTFYHEYGVINSAKKKVIKFGESFEMAFFDGQNGCKVNYKNSNKIRILATDLAFLLSYIEYGYFEINGAKIPFDSANADFSNFDIEEQKIRLEFARRSVQVLDMLNCKADIDLSSLKESDIRNLERLATALIDKKPVGGLKEDLQIVSIIEVGTLKFAMVCEPTEEKGKYNLVDFFRSEFNLVYEYEEIKAEPTSQYVILKSNNLLELSNLRTDAVFQSFLNLRNKKSYVRENWFLLTVIEAYDLSEDKRTDLLELALNLSNWLKEKSTDIETQISELNYLQVIKRQRALNIMEVDALWNIIEDKSSTDICKVGAYLLTDQQVPAERIFNKLPKANRDEFKTFPIYRFWKN